MRNRYFFSILILNFNGYWLIRDCLLHIEKQTFSDYEVIVVDNGSTDGSVDFLRRYVSGKKNYKLILLNENKGYTGGNNIGFKHVEGKYILLLNNDAFVKEDFLMRAYQHIKENNEYQMFATKVLRWDDPNVIDKVGHLIYPDGLNRGRGHLQRDEGQFDEVEEILWPDGSAAIYSRELIQDVGGFDEVFFAYGDDADLGMRSRLLGYKAQYLPFCISLHKHSSTAGRFSPLKIMLVERNRLFLLVKNFPLKKVLISPYYTFIRYAYNFYGLLKNRGSAGEFKRENGSFKLFFALLKAYVSFLKNLPHILSERRKIQKSRKLSTREICKILEKYRIDVKELTLN